MKFISELLKLMRVERFDNKGEYKYLQTNGLYVFLAFLLTLVLLAFLGEYLWNNYLVEYVTVVKPLRSPLDIIAISVLLSLIANL